MKNIAEIRQQNFRYLLDTYFDGNVTAFSNHPKAIELGINVVHMRTTARKPTAKGFRPIGSELARKIEEIAQEVCDIEDNWLDQDWELINAQGGGDIKDEDLKAWIEIYKRMNPTSENIAQTRAHIDSLNEHKPEANGNKTTGTHGKS